MAARTRQFVTVAETRMLRRTFVVLTTTFRLKVTNDMCERESISTCIVYLSKITEKYWKTMLNKLNN